MIDDKCKTKLLTIIVAYTAFCNEFEKDNIFNEDDLSCIGAMLFKLYAEGFNLTHKQVINDLTEFKHNLDKGLN